MLLLLLSGGGLLLVWPLLLGAAGARGWIAVAAVCAKREGRGRGSRCNANVGQKRLTPPKRICGANTINIKPINR